MNVVTKEVHFVTATIITVRIVDVQVGTIAFEEIRSTTTDTRLGVVARTDTCSIRILIKIHVDS